MSFSEFFTALAALARDPRTERAAWDRRGAFRAELRRLLDQPNLLADVDFDPAAARAEVKRKPWQEVLLLRGPASTSPVPRRSVSAFAETGCPSPAVTACDGA